MLAPHRAPHELGLAVARLGCVGPCVRFAARPAVSANLTPSAQAHLPMGREPPQGAVTLLGHPLRGLALLGGYPRLAAPSGSALPRGYGFFIMVLTKIVRL